MSVAMKPNADYVKSYYTKNKHVILCRKKLTRCRLAGAIPTKYAMQTYDIPVTALLVSFGQWASACGDESLVQQQCASLRRLRKSLENT